MSGLSLWLRRAIRGEPGKAMLILTRKPGECLYIGDDVKITVVEIKGNQIRIGIEAPQNVRIYREEIYVQILEENRKAAGSGETEDGLAALLDQYAGTMYPNSLESQTTPHDDSSARAQGHTQNSSGSLSRMKVGSVSLSKPKQASRPTEGKKQRHLDDPTGVEVVMKRRPSKGSHD